MRGVVTKVLCSSKHGTGTHGPQRLVVCRDELSHPRLVRRRLASQPLLLQSSSVSSAGWTASQRNMHQVALQSSLVLLQFRIRGNHPLDLLKLLLSLPKSICDSCAPFAAQEKCFL